ncbi:MAG: hypothetical protein KDD51_06155 [Bdellovibrionales bacterium]|nr:hypothetical protein [Bdellovibrionales bacterium]
MKLAWLLLALCLPLYAAHFGPEIFGKGFESAGGDYITPFSKLDKKMATRHVRVTVRRNGFGICKYRLKGIGIKHTRGSDIFSTYTPYDWNVETGDFRSDTEYLYYFHLSDSNLEEIQFFLENAGENDNIWDCAVTVHAEPYTEILPSGHADLTKYSHLDAILFAGGSKIRALPLGPEGKGLKYVRVQIPSFCDKSLRLSRVSVIDSEKEACELRLLDKEHGIYLVHLPPKRTATYVELELEAPEKIELCAVPVSLFRD